MALYSVLNPILVYTSLDGVYFTLQSSSNLNTIIITNYNVPCIIHDGTKVISCGYCISSGPAICYSTDGITWTACTGCSNLNLNYICFINGVYLCQGIFGYMHKSADGIAWSTVPTVYNTSGSGPSILQMLQFQ